ncbi:hypothetical protein BKA70DRAFT_1218239 [Coprinopsis sp. MPI-PUGE-AT-0042]|nr:hypothetical protein BKA70DRAFT_1218239 [Coprinopsis sp. MPI-PUGE-AT-0042]
MAQQTLILAPIYSCDYDGRVQWNFVDQHGPELQGALFLAQYNLPSRFKAARELIDSMLNIYGVSTHLYKGESYSRALDQKQTLATLELLHSTQLLTDAAYSKAVEAVVSTGTYRDADDTNPSLLPLDYEARTGGDWSHISHKTGSVFTLECLALDGCVGTGVLVPVEKQAHAFVPAPESPTMISSKDADVDRVFVNITFECPGYGTDDCD